MDIPDCQFLKVFLTPRASGLEAVTFCREREEYTIMNTIKDKTKKETDSQISNGQITYLPLIQLQNPISYHILQRPCHLSNASFSDLLEYHT